MGSIDAACIAGFLCRLCSEMHRTVIHIYGDQGQKHGLAQKINEYLPVTITPTDPLPKTICETCLTRVEQHHDLMLKMAKTRAHFARIHDQVTLLRNELTQTDERLSSNATSTAATAIAPIPSAAELATTTSSNISNRSGTVITSTMAASGGGRGGSGNINNSGGVGYSSSDITGISSFRRVVGGAVGSVQQSDNSNNWGEGRHDVESTPSSATTPTTTLTSIAEAAVAANSLLNGIDDIEISRNIAISNSRNRGQNSDYSNDSILRRNNIIMDHYNYHHRNN